MSYRARVVKSVEYNSITLNGVTSGTYTLATTVDKNYSIIELMAITSASGSNDANVNCMRVELTSNTTVTAFVSASEGSNHVAYFRVTQYYPWAFLQPVQHKSNTLSFTAVGARGEVFNGGFTSGNTGNTASSIVGGVTKTSSTTVSALGGAGVVAYCVADWK